MLSIFSSWFKQPVENKRHVCSHCGEKFSCFWKWEDHDYTHHDPDGPMEPVNETNRN